MSRYAINANEILPLVRTAGKVASGGRSPHLRVVWLKFVGTDLFISATDGQVDYQGRVVLASPVQDELLVGLDGNILAGLLGRMGGEAVELEVEKGEDGEMVRLRQGRRKFDLAAMQAYWFSPGDAYPEKAGGFFLSGGELAEIIGSVDFSVSPDDTMGPFACLYLGSNGDGRAAAVALNGHQMAVRRFPAGQILSAVPESGLLLHRRFLGGLKSWMENLEIEATLYNNKLHLRDAGRSEHWSVPVNKDVYPEWVQLLKKSGDGSQAMIAHRVPLLEALERLKLFTSDEAMAVHMIPGDQAMELSSGVQSKGKGADYVPIAPTGNIPKIAFPIDDLLKILGKFKGEEVLFTFQGSEGPCIIKDQAGGDEYLVLLMPMQINDEVVLDEEVAE